jgi:hydroxymethylpyrimidine pyrophosphatase-like HAD family hydrolase/MoaA/NifB/PqqE/SkfB family radical SAM enzyme
MLEGVKNICFRGSLSSCNYSCSYCSFAKRGPRKTELMKDKACLSRFCDFIDTTSFTNQISIFLTPHGEGLIHPHYVEAIARLALSPKCRYISCQTNLSFDSDAFIKSLIAAKVDLSKVKLWATCHPGMISIDEFVSKVNQLKASIDLCVGIVAIPEELHNVFELRKRLPKDIYMWINAMKRAKTKYTDSQIKTLIQADPLFPNELQKFRVQPGCCHAGTDSVYINANGDVFPCHINKNRLFNIYRNSSPVLPFQCDKRFCDCYLAYSHRTDSNLERIFGDYTPVRIPNKKEIEALFLDVDGTITDESGAVSEKAIEQIRFLKDKIRIYLVTALPLHIAMKKCNRIKSFISGGVFANGGQIVDFGLHYRQIVSLEKEVLEAVSDIPQIKVYKENDSVYKLSAFSKHIPPYIKSDSRLKLTYERNLVSINSNSASKLEGIRKICMKNGFCEDKVFVMGNSMNDLEMICHFENSAATIDSKCRALKEQAGYILNSEHLAIFVKT